VGIRNKAPRKRTKGDLLGLLPSSENVAKAIIKGEKPPIWCESKLLPGTEVDRREPELRGSFTTAANGLNNPAERIEKTYPGVLSFENGQQVEI
jgi:hypothetical protein